MEKKYCQIVVNTKTKNIDNDSFTYSYPASQQSIIKIGQLVLVPFGRRLIQGIIIDLPSSSLFPGNKTKSIKDIIYLQPILNKYQIALARYISSYYFCSLGRAIFAMIPSFILQSSVNTYQLDQRKKINQNDQTKYPILSFFLEQTQPISEHDLIKKYGSMVKKQLTLLVKFKYLIKQQQFLPPVGQKKYQEVIFLNPNFSPKITTIKSKPQKAILEYLLYRRSAPWATIKNQTSASRSALVALIKKEIVLSKKEQIIRLPQIFSPKNPMILKLTDEQTKAIREIEKQQQNQSPKPILLFGRTGSGKTEIYLQMTEKILAQGKTVIVLVPEIALLPQTILRFLERFPDQIAIYHSHMSVGERYDQWSKILQGEAKIVIGSRSALFTPINNLGLIIIDEEHEFSYKQDMTPRYHAVDVASHYAKLTRSILVLGSATPRLETFWRAKKGVYQLIKLDKSVKRRDNEKPQFYQLDLRDEYAAGNKSLLSYSLQLGIKEALTQKKQILLFLNRRGHATYVFCRECGYVANCQNCQIPLTYHSDQSNYLVCHHCGLKQANIHNCPQCSGQAIRYYGAGTQKLFQDVSFLFPAAKILRMDHDTTRGKDAHQKIFADFRAHRADILIGTQMIAKGWDLPNVDLVGIINADAGFNLPDFRSTERNFALLLQLIGRVGRGQTPGKVYLQTFDPENPLLEILIREDYQLFAFSELIERQKGLFPPFVDLVRLTYESTNLNQCQVQALNLFKSLNQAFHRQKKQDLKAILGPAPAFLSRINNKYRWHIILKGQHLQSFLHLVPPNWTIDIDPYSLL